MLAEADVRRVLVYVMMTLLGAVNLATLVSIYLFFRVDQADLADRLIGSEHRIVSASV
jgi:hypothetical protein